MVAVGELGSGDIVTSLLVSQKHRAPKQSSRWLAVCPPSSPQIDQHASRFIGILIECSRYRWRTANQERGVCSHTATIINTKCVPITYIINSIAGFALIRAQCIAVARCVNIESQSQRFRSVANTLADKWPAHNDVAAWRRRRSGRRATIRQWP